MVLPVLAIIFVAWAAADLFSYATTGEDTVYHLANFLGWTGEVDPGDNILIEWGMSGMEFLINYWLFISMFLAVVFVTMWLATRPIKRG
jgi:hypothetical protein